jgi:uncharacterized protein YecE (DUF72 family)
MMRVHVGTSGYNYPEWRGSFYPDALPAKQMFAFYAGRFRTVEINYTFYRMPTANTTAAWREQAPGDFTYTLKAPRTITHVRRLKDAGEALAFFCDSARVLGPHLGALLFQLPPNLKCDAGRLDAFLASMPAGVRPAFEFRHDSWLNEEVHGILAARNAALVIADFGDRTTPLRATARHGYFRLRDEGYTPADLEVWADRLLDLGEAWEDAFVYFKHEDAGKGPEFARLFAEILTRRGVSVR